MEIFHIARAEDWDEAGLGGQYTVSTLDRTLDEVGFIHAARPEQVGIVYDAFYAGKGLDLVLLTIDTDRLDVPWSEDPVGDTTYPHVHGPLAVGAVVDVQPLPDALDGLD